MTGYVNYTDKLAAFEDAYALVEQDAGYILRENLQDRSFRAALNLAGWKPIGDPQALAVEWYQMDYEYAETVVSGVPELSFPAVSMRSSRMYVLVSR